MACSRVKTEDKEEQDAIMPEEVTLEDTVDRGMRKRKQRGELKRQAADGAAGAGPSVR